MSIITNYIINEILSEAKISSKDNTSGKFILRNYPLSIFQSLIDYFSMNEYREIIFIIDEKLQLNINEDKFIKATHEVMAQYRNENIKNLTKNLNETSYILFITNDTIDTLNDINTLTVDDIRDKFENIIDLIENKLIKGEVKKRLKNISKVLLREIEEISPFEMENFISLVMDYMEREAYPLEEAIGLSLNELNSFKCHKCFEFLKKNALIRDIKKIVKPIKFISSSLSKRVGTKTLSNEELKEKFDENIEEFNILETKTKELIEEFIRVDFRKLSNSKEKFKQLDWHKDSIYRLFEKSKSDTSKKLGKDTISLLQERDIELDEIEKNNLFQYDEFKPKERDSLRDILEPLYKRYKGFIDENRILRGKWDKFLYPSQSKSNNFILGLLDTIKKLKVDSDNIHHITLSLKYSQTSAIMRNYSKYAINYLHKRYSILNRVSKNIHFNFEFIQEIETKGNNTKLTDTVKKFKKGNSSKLANELHFIVQAQNEKNEKLAERKLIWSFNPNTILSGYREDIEAIETHLAKNSIYSTKVNRASGSEKGEKKRLSLFDYSSLESSGKNAGYRLFPKRFKANNTNISSKNIINSAKEFLDKENFKTFKELFDEYIKEYAWLLNQLDIKNNLEKKEFDFNLVEKFSQLYIKLSKIMFANSENDKFKRSVIEPFLSLLIVKVSLQECVIIPSYHPLRLISYFVKLKNTFNFIDEYIKSSDTLMIKEELYFNDLKQNFTTPYYPELFRIFDIDGNEESILHISQICDDYTILEPIKIFLDNGENSDPLAQATILTKVIENYFTLNRHKESSLKVLLHAVNNYNFPIKFMKKLISMGFSSKDNSVEIYLNDVDATHIRKMYRDFLINQNSKESEEIFEYNEVSFLSNIRLNAFDQSFKQLDTINDQLNIAFLSDFISSKAKLEFKKQLLNRPFSLFEYNPTLWSKRKYMTENEVSIGKYLIPPAKSDLTSAFYDLLFLTMGANRDDFIDKIPTLTIDINHKNLSLDLEAIHKRTDWVVNLDSLVDKKILEEFGANVIKYRKARHINRNLVISSKANTILLKNHLTKKFKDFGVNEEVIKSAIENIINLANELSGDILLKAIGKGSFANEMLGLSLTKIILDNLTSNSSIMIYIDDFADWFLSSVNVEEDLLLKQSSVLADILSITPIFKDKTISTIYIDIVEVKFCNEANRPKLAKKSLQQTKDSFIQIKKIFEDNNYYDREYWLAKISDLIVETHHKSFINNLTSEDIRNEIRLNTNINFIVRGFSFIFVYDYKDDDFYESEENEVIQYIIGSKSIVNIIENLSNFDISSTLKLPKYEESISNSKESFLETKIEEKVIQKEVTNETKSNTQKEIKRDLEVSSVQRAVKQVLIHHSYRAKIKNYLFTPNALRISLEPELGWNEKIFYNMSNDFLTVKGLELLRVEPIKGAYDLIFKRENREIVLYEECIEDREVSEGVGNTKILLGRSEKDNSILYYNLDSEDPHALIGGMTKSGKSVLLNIFIIDLIQTNTPNELQLILIDPKQVEFTRYKNIPYLDKDGIITTKELAIQKLHEVVDEMEKRYKLFAKMGVNEIKKYNAQVEDKLPRIILIFDEFADWMLNEEFKKSTSEAVQSLSGKARAAGIHLIVSTQRPDNSVVIPILRANLGAKFALRVDSDKNSNIILNESGAEKLLGYGHMIAKFAGTKEYIQTAFISDEYIKKVLSLYNS